MKTMFEIPTDDAIHFRDERMRMIYENMETRFMPDILGKKLLALPMPGVVKDQMAK